MTPDGPDLASPVALTSLTDLSVHRASYGHGREGALVGLLLGTVVALSINSTCEASDCYFIPSEGLYAILGGTLLGFGIGSAARTEIWSPMELDRLTPARR